MTGEATILVEERAPLRGVSRGPHAQRSRDGRTRRSKAATAPADRSGGCGELAPVRERARTALVERLSYLCDRGSRAGRSQSNCMIPWLRRRARAVRMRVDFAPGLVSREPLALLAACWCAGSAEPHGQPADRLYLASQTAPVRGDRARLPAPNDHGFAESAAMYRGRHVPGWSPAGRETRPRHRGRHCYGHADWPARERSTGATASLLRRPKDGHYRDSPSAGMSSPGNCGSVVILPLSVSTVGTSGQSRLPSARGSPPAVDGRAGSMTRTRRGHDTVLREQLTFSRHGTQQPRARGPQLGGPLETRPRPDGSPLGRRPNSGRGPHESRRPPPPAAERLPQRLAHTHSAGCSS